MIERFEGLELSLERAINTIPKRFRSEYRQAYHWLIRDAGTTGSRPYGEHAPSNISLKLAAQRGIHKPSGRPYALTVSSSGNEIYAADQVHELDDGTWMFQYCAHRKNAGEREGSPAYNASLRKCLRDGIPVGVFIKEGATWSHKGLAFVERFDSDADMFWLHGPVTDGNSDMFSPVPRDERAILVGEFDSSIDTNAIDAELDTADERERVRATVVRRKQQGIFRQKLLEAYKGACAITGYDAEPALQAAHISSYLGRKSQLASNGLLLRSDLHILYDRAWLSVDPAHMVVRIAPQLMNSRYAELEGTRIAIPKDKALRPSEARLEMKYSDFLLINRMAR